MPFNRSHFSFFQTRQGILTILLCVLLLVKFLWPLFVYHQPLGYDPGFYRYLLIRHSEAFPPLTVAELPTWAKGHPLGMFIITSPLIHLGVPVDWIIGWIWNVFCVFTAGVLALVTGKKYGTLAGMGTLIAASISVAYFDGFAAMYMKTIVSLFWSVFCFAAIEKRSWVLAAITGLLTIVSHNQTGLLFILTVGTWSLQPMLPFTHSTEESLLQHLSLKKLLFGAVISAVVIAAGIYIYLPVLQESVLEHLPALLGKTESSGGSFPPFFYYARTQGLLLAIGLFGLFYSLRRERFTLWQLSVLWSAVFIVFRLIFYRRFFLQFDFYLMMFAGLGFSVLWSLWKDWLIRSFLILLVIIQLVVSLIASFKHEPLMGDETFAAVKDVAATVEEAATVLALDNDSAVLLRGWLPYRHIGGPGLFESTWSREEWEKLLLGSTSEQTVLLQSVSQPAYVFITPYFRTYYGSYVSSFLENPCLRETITTMLFRISCPTP